MNSIGVIGLGVMGRSLSLNFERNGYSVAAFDLDDSKRIDAKIDFSNKNMIVVNKLPRLIEQLESPRKILLMVPAGKAVDSVIDELVNLIQPGDIIIDGGNSHFLDTQRRTKELQKKELLYIGVGVSGGEEGALWGPSMMPGGNADAWPAVKSLFQAIAAKTEKGESCAEWVGNDGAGHFVKMVHNGIEYGDMQMISEAYMLMKDLLGMKPEEMSEVFNEWNKGELNSYLIEITGNILSKKEEATGNTIVDLILDSAGQKGTGKWTSQAALDLGVPAQTIAEAVFARAISSLKEERVEAAKVLKGPEIKIKGDKKEFIENIRQALFASKICSYAQGFQLMKSANEEYRWQLNFGNIVLLWSAGCIIRAKFLDNIKEAYMKNPQLPNLLLNNHFIDIIQRSQKSWRTVVAEAVVHGIPVPAMSSAIAYYDSYRNDRLPANLLQAQRDYFGAHTYERVDKARGEFFHTNWIAPSGTADSST